MTYDIWFQNEVRSEWDMASWIWSPGYGMGITCHNMTSGYEVQLWRPTKTSYQDVVSQRLEPTVLMELISGRLQGYHHQLPHAVPAWWGYTDACSRLHLQAVVYRLRRLGLLPSEFPTHEELCEHLCGKLFRQVLHNWFHILHQLLPLWKRLLMGYNLVPITGSSQGLTIESPRQLYYSRQVYYSHAIRMLYK